MGSPRQGHPGPGQLLRPRSGQGRGGPCVWCSRGAGGQASILTVLSILILTSLFVSVSLGNCHPSLGGTAGREQNGP